MTIELFNESGVDAPDDQIIEVARFALGAMDVHRGAELSIQLVDLDTMADLHVQWMDLPGPTDVMSFPMDELTPGGRPDAAEPGPAMLGDIVLCPEFAADQAKKQRHSYEHELAVLTVHGVLHLLGFDHAEPAEEAEMFGLQNQILRDWYDAREARLQARKQAEKDRRLMRDLGFDADAGRD
ncbi:putative rRNA maturation factor [Gordonia hirsuta DSM 44140 = NBRC 16056]|uniref:Endoribonuclease YbeY n=1 Tax=Gordonia hirsuta DSM 44140 = NBRC 16056 TaxID=1121927 RepID=L7L8C1_9ACTN|nr:rRNA maturation RNase YbeY [Gordonia hirsuta]GAC57169.1 putative rRNA maturation factor [Gordonia hirsuta DSM 44140 = NBRC 16056]